MDSIQKRYKISKNTIDLYIFFLICKKVQNYICARAFNVCTYNYSGMYDSIHFSSKNYYLSEKNTKKIYQDVRLTKVNFLL